MSTTPELVAQLRKKGVELRLDDGALRYSAIQGALTPADMELLRSRRQELVYYLQARKAAERPAIKKTSAPPAPSCSQQVWWRWARGAGNDANYNIPFTVLLEDADETRARSALWDMVRHHDILRYTFTENAGVLAVRLNTPEAFDPALADLRHLPAADAQARAETGAAGFSRPPVILDGDWLIRAKLFLLPQSKVLVAIVFNHILGDATSCALMAETLKTASHKDGVDAGNDSPDWLQFNDYVANEREWVEVTGGHILIDYWQHWESQVPPLLSPVEKTRVAWRPGEKVWHQFTLGAWAPAAIRQISRQVAASEHLVYLTIFAITIARWSGQCEFAVRSMSDTRSTTELIPIVGFLFCADAIAIRLPPQNDFGAILRAIETEYHATIQRRLPTMPMVAPHVVHPEVPGGIQPSLIAATLNFIPFRGAPSDGKADLDERVHWPPPTERFSEHWSNDTVPIFFQLADLGAALQGRMQFNAALLTEAEQTAFLATLFSVLRETLRPPS